jgi:AmmeMemoRadiSam system protein B
MDGYRTPLGALAIAPDGLASPVVRPNPAVYLREHAVEMQLPWLQTVAPDAALVPLLFGSVDAADIASLAGALRASLTPETLVIASSDLVHYGRRFDYLPVPPSDRHAVEAAVARVDEAALACIAAGDADAFARFVVESGATICGRAALEVVLRALPPGTTGTVLARATSLDADGDYEHTVGYGAVSFTAPSA